MVSFPKEARHGAQMSFARAGKSLNIVLSPGGHFNLRSQNFYHREKESAKYLFIHKISSLSVLLCLQRMGASVSIWSMCGYKRLKQPRVQEEENFNQIPFFLKLQVSEAFICTNSYLRTHSIYPKIKCPSEAS